MAEVTIERGSAVQLRDRFMVVVGTEVKSHDPVLRPVAAETSDIPETSVLLPFAQLKAEAIKVGPFGKEYPFDDYLAEKRLWQGIFGPEVDIPYPPQAMVDILRNAREKGIRSFSVRYFPEMGVSQKGLARNGRIYEYPQNWMYPESLSDDDMATGNNRHIPSCWILIENTEAIGIPLMHNAGYANEPLAGYFGDSKLGCLAEGSRFGITHDQVVEEVLPNMGSYLGINENMKQNGITITLPSVSEYIVLDNLNKGCWMENAKLKEWCRDKTAENPKNSQTAQLRICRAYSPFSHYYYLIDRAHNVKDVSVGFRPMIVVPVVDQK